MPHFQIHMNGRLIGHSELEYGDAPMGVAHGRFIPSPEYFEVQARIAGSYGDQAHLEFSAFSEDSTQVPCQAVAICDQSAELGPEEMYVELLGVPYPEYQAIFPHHVAAYERQFPSSP